MPETGMISISARSVTRTPDDRTRLTFTMELPARDEIGGARQAERSLQAALHEAGREVMEHLLTLYDTDGEPLDQGRARLTSKGRQEQTYQSLFGPVRVAARLSERGGRGHVVPAGGARPHSGERHLPVRRRHRRQIQRAERQRRAARP
ncbi:MAG: hypothetical protein EON58_01190 [Alphaproteobacteria bacterium]|nr:MAG: hypothetical protein EON58_01190 [Alphaproteobacteria bacterium]